jgi:cytochrome c oxidase subunit II
MKKIILLLFSLVSLMTLYSHDGEETGHIANKIIFGDRDNFTIMEISVANWNFSEEEIILDKDTKTRLIFKIESGHHGISIPDLELKSGNMKKDELVSWDLADLSEGEYSFYCNVPCGQGHSTMRGKLVVK